jgi:hypothetical protein
MKQNKRKKRRCQYNSYISNCLTLRFVDWQWESKIWYCLHMMSLKSNPDSSHLWKLDHKFSSALSWIHVLQYQVGLVLTFHEEGFFVNQGCKWLLWKGLVFPWSGPMPLHLATLPSCHMGHQWKMWVTLLFELVKEKTKGQEWDFTIHLYYYWGEIIPVSFPISGPFW